MVYDFLICRSLTYAQRTASALGRAGISAYVTRIPRAISGDGCGYAVKVSQRKRSDALRVLSRVGIAPLRIYALEPGGTYREVTA